MCAVYAFDLPSRALTRRHLCYALDPFMVLTLRARHAPSRPSDMSESKQVLCIDPNPGDLGIGALLTGRGLSVDLTEASSRDGVQTALEQPERWDLILCNAVSFEQLGVDALLAAAKDESDASLVLLKSTDSDLSSGQSYGLGAADLVRRDDRDHLFAVCERELGHSALRREIRQLRGAAMRVDAGAVRPPLMLATIQDLSPAGRQKKSDAAAGDGSSASRAGAVGPDRISDRARIRALIDAGGLTLEFQPIICLRGEEEPRSMFETLVRLKDGAGNLLMPGEFLPVVAAAGWMPKIDTWIFRRALKTLREMQDSGSEQTILFINVATETLRCEETSKALGAFVSAARLTSGSVVVEVRKSAFSDAAASTDRLARLLKAKQHGLLVEDAGVDDCSFLAKHSDVVTHIKLDRAMTQGLVERRLSQESVADLVQCARAEGIRVIALAVDNAELLPMLFAIGVDAIQGHFVSMPYQTLMYPSIQRVESSSNPPWQGST